MRLRRAASCAAAFALAAAGCSAIVSYDGYGDGVRAPDAAEDGDGTTPPDDGSSDALGGGDGTMADSGDADVLVDAGDAGDAATKKYALVVLGGSRYSDAGVSTSVDTVEVAEIHTDGTLGSFAVTTSMPYTEHQVGAAVYGSSIVISGDKGTAGAVLQPDGGLSAWTTLATPAAQNNTRLTAVGDNVLQVSGTVSGVESAAAYRTKFTGPTTIGAWTATTSLPADGGARTYSELVASGDFVYLLGGNVASTDLGDVLRSSVDATGAVGAWSSGALPDQGENLCAVVANGHVLLLGGSFATVGDKNIYSAAIQIDGSLGAWQLSGQQRPAQHDEPAFAAHGAVVYLVGGRMSGNVDITTVSYATVGAGGFPGAWQATSPLTVSRHDARAVVVELP